MEYEFTHDIATGGAKANFSLEHQLIGPWLETEVGSNIESLTEVLQGVESVEQGKQQELTIVGKEYSLTLTKNDAIVQLNALVNGSAQLPEELAVDTDAFEQQGANCGIDDFRSILLSWAQFTKK